MRPRPITIHRSTHPEHLIQQNYLGNPRDREKIATVERLAYGEDDGDVSAEDSSDPNVNKK